MKKLILKFILWHLKHNKIAFYTHTIYGWKLAIVVHSENNIKLKPYNFKQYELDKKEDIL